MKIFCFMPGCLKIEQEEHRRVYVWLMIPWLGMILLGMESGLTVSTSSHIFGSYCVGLLSLLPHGIVEIPAIALAGAVTFSAHLLVKEKTRKNLTEEIFQSIENYKNEVSMLKIISVIVFWLAIAGLVEGHLTEMVIEYSCS